LKLYGKRTIHSEASNLVPCQRSPPLPEESIPGTVSEKNTLPCSFHDAIRDFDSFQKVGAHPIGRLLLAFCDHRILVPSLRQHLIAGAELFVEEPIGSLDKETLLNGLGVFCGGLEGVDEHCMYTIRSL